jgi:L-lactate dehydrogenase complex protein LldF
MSAPLTFYDRVEEALHNPQLREATSLAAKRMASRRRWVMNALPEAEALRDHARRIKAHTIAHLDRYLAQFADAVEARGGHVYWGDTAADANRYVTELAQQRGVKTVVKSKSMVSEELELNHALEALQIRVMETDLGEYIIQLAGEKPSHIIAPVLHNSKEEVAQLFQEKLNATPEEVADVTQMTALARRLLRQDFLQADMGISGANFGVAETGSICLVTNEGNGRLTTTAPRLHVALLGMERLIPTMEDLGVMLQLLARNGTGQKISVYSNIITGPRLEGEPDGPDELHVVIVDNGRSQILNGELAEILYCIRCGACLNVCPVYQQIGGHAYGSVYPGPVGSVVTPGLEGIGPWSELPHASTLCGACHEVCPMRIDIPRLLLKLREESVQAGLAPGWLKKGLGLFRYAAVRPGFYHNGGQLAGAVSRMLAKEGWIGQLPGPLSAWTDERDFPAMAPQSFHHRWQKERRQ